MPTLAASVTFPYYWDTMPDRLAMVRSVLADAGR
jgi:hypothetical protein